MIAALGPSLILSVAADVVHELQGEDALSSLWTVFTKCKNSLKDGQRLENLSWRLWYRELAARRTPASPDSLLPPTSEMRRISTPNTHILDAKTCELADLQPHSSHGYMASFDTLATSLRINSTSVPGRRPMQHAAHTGRLLTDILPAGLSLALPSEKPQPVEPEIVSPPRPPSSDPSMPSRLLVSVSNVLPTMTLNCPQPVLVELTLHSTIPALPQGPPRSTNALPSLAQASVRHVSPLPIATSSSVICPAGHTVYATIDSGDRSERVSDNSESEPTPVRQAQEAHQLWQATEEAQRQREMFVKVPRRSYIALPRTNSGLLSQLLNPDPTIFPPDHPYHRSFCAPEMAQLSRQDYDALPSLLTSKRSAALPQVAAAVTQAPCTDSARPNSKEARDSARAKRGCPQGTELEGSDSEGDENTDNGIQVSDSQAQQTLAALADLSQRRHSNQVHVSLRPSAASQILGVAAAPIPLDHPYNLPVPAPPMTPRATRRQMLSTELSESLRRNLLWERRVSQNRLRPKRSSLLSIGGSGSRNGEDERKQRAYKWADDYHSAGW